MIGRTSEARPRCLSLLLALTATLAIVFARMDARAQTRLGYTSLGDFSLIGKPILEADIIKKYGQGFLIVRFPGTEIESRAHVYFDSTQKLWIRLDASAHENEGTFVVEEINVSVVPFAKDTVLPKSPFSPFRTKNNVHIGMRESEVVKIMGKPSRIDDAVARDARTANPGRGSIWGSRVMVYFPELQQPPPAFYVHLEKGIVRSLTLSSSE